MKAKLLLLVAFSMLWIAADVIRAEQIFPRLRCRSVARSHSERLRPARELARVAGKPHKEFEQPASASAARSLFNGRDLTGWSVIEKYDFERHGDIAVEDGAIILRAGAPATGLRFDGEFPRINYEVTLETKRVEGADFFCGITFPVGDDYLSLVLGGWGGGTTGISNLDNMSAIENETTGFQEFEQNRWYRIRLRVTDDKVETWLDDEQIVDVEHRKHKLSIWWEQEPVRPFGIASWYTTSALREVRLTRL